MAKSTDLSIEQSIAELAGKSDHKILAIWATDCAERVLSYFEKIYSEDDRPRKAIEAGRAWVRGELKMIDARKAAFAAHAAARDAKSMAAACSAARAAGHAAATAHVATHAVHAAAYAIAAVRDTSDSIKAEVATATERLWQYERLLMLGQS